MSTETNHTNGNSGEGSQLERFAYDNATVRKFLIATTVFGVIGMLVGLTVACQFFWPELNFGIPYTTFGRIPMP